MRHNHLARLFEVTLLLVIAFYFGWRTLLGFDQVAVRTQQWMLTEKLTKKEESKNERFPCRGWNNQ